MLQLWKENTGQAVEIQSVVFFLVLAVRILTLGRSLDASTLQSVRVFIEANLVDMWCKCLWILGSYSDNKQS